MIDNQTIVLAIIVSAIATYFCRSMGVLFSSRLRIDSWIFDWIKCISIGIIVAVISKIIIFPEGILKSTSQRRIYISFHKEFMETTLVQCAYMG